MAKRETTRDGVADMRQQLKNGLPAPCILLYGEEGFLVAHWLEEIRNAVLKPDTRDFNEVLLEGRVKPEAICDACETYPVFAERKLVIVRKSGLFKAAVRKKAAEDADAAGDAAGDASDGSDADAEGLAAADPVAGQEADGGGKYDWKPFFESFPSHTLLVFVEETANRTLGLYKLIDKHGLAAEMTFQKPDVLNKWIQKGFARSGKRIAPPDADYLMHQAEDGMTALHQEIVKICLFMGDRTDVTRDDIRAVVIPSIRSRVFDLMDAVAGGSRATALVMLDEMIQKREAEQKIFYMIARQAGRLYQLKRMGPGVPAEQKADRLGMNAFAMTKMERLAARLPVEALAKFVRDCADMDMAVKSGRIRIRLALELLIAGIGAA